MECGRQRSRVKTLLLQLCALCKIHVTDGQTRVIKFSDSQLLWLRGLTSEVAGGQVIF